MAFCKECRDRRPACLRQCERLVRGEYLWRVVQDELMRGRMSQNPASNEEEKREVHLTWERQAEDVRSAFVVGAQAIRDMPR